MDKYKRKSATTASQGRETRKSLRSDQHSENDTNNLGESSSRNEGTSSERQKRKIAPTGEEEPRKNLKTDIPNEDVDMVDEANILEDEEGGTRIGDIYIPPPIKPHCSTESKGPRLIITKIENENFKSYAGKVTLGPFHHRFTAIIGPNGSGKSNVIDSMLFVFGYRAQKIRCKKLSILLHNSAKCPDTQMCNVAVHFKLIVDNKDGGYEEVPNSQFSIGRKAFKDNSSFYTINGRKAQFKEVYQLLRKHGVDLDHNRFLILQGEVESIAMMKPKALTENETGMLEYLEDIIGTTRYKEPLIKINCRVEELTAERTEKHNRCKLAEREMKDLERPYNEAIDYLKLKNTLTRATNLQIQKYLNEQSKKLLEYTNESEEIKAELNKHDEEYDQLKKQRLEKEAAEKEEIAKFEEMCKEKEIIEQKFKDALNKFSETQASMVATNKRRHQNITQLKKYKEQLKELEAVPEKNCKEIEECERKIEQLTAQKTGLEEQLQKNYILLENETKPLVEKREALETELIDLKKNADIANGEHALVESELRLLIQDEVSEKRKYETLKSSFDESQADLIEKQKKIDENKALIPEIKKQIITNTKQIQKHKEEEEIISSKLFGIRAEISEKMSSMQLAKSNNKVLDALMRQKHEGKIPGILGRLGDLGAIDAKYDVAISTACGRLDNIIVDTVNTAQACIEHLKRYDIGRASFIALEKVQHLQRYCQERIDTPENVPRLFDLIKVEDERVLPAFYFSLRDTLVADDLEQGSRIAYGAVRYRVVTLNGDLIETSGTMSGGGRVQMRGKMGQKVTTKTANTSIVSQKALEDLQIQAEEMQHKINYLQQEQGRLENEVHQLNSSLHAKEVEVNKMTITIESLSEQLPRLREQLKMQKLRVERTKTDPEQVKEKEEELAQKKEALQKAETAAGKITSKIAEINKKVSDIHSNKVKSVQTKINNTTKQINSLTANVSKLKVDIKSSERNREKIKKEIDNLEEDVRKAEDAIKKLSEERSQYDAEAVEWTEKIEKAKENIEKTAKVSPQLQNDIATLQKKENDFKLKRVEIEEKLQIIEKKISDVKSQLPHWQNKLKPLKLQEIPGETELLEPLKFYTEEELNTYKLQDLQYQSSVLTEKLNAKKPNLTVIDEYTNKREVYLERVQILEDVTNRRNEMRQLYDDVRRKRYTEFMQGFHIITRKLKEIYQMITQGGDAELELVDSMDPFTEGVSFSVRPPKKTWKNISNLSGGEKTLSSLALVFALHYYKPSPLYFMDEIDAALDFKNISIVAHYIKERTKNAQFIIISLRSSMFELSDYLIGIYKVYDCTNTVTIKNYPPDILNGVNAPENNAPRKSIEQQQISLRNGTTDNSEIAALNQNEVFDSPMEELNNCSASQSQSITNPMPLPTPISTE